MGLPHGWQYQANLVALQTLRQRSYSLCDVRKSPTMLDPLQPNLAAAELNIDNPVLRKHSFLAQEFHFVGLC